MSNTVDSEYFDADISPEELIRKGEVLFIANCKSCHSLDINHPTALAPVLDSIAFHWPKKADLAKFIKNAPDMKQFNAHTRLVHRLWKNKSQMPPFMGLQADEVECIINYLHENTK